MQWVIPNLGPKAVVFVGHMVADHARAAIQLLSSPVLRRSIYTHLGWVHHEGQWLFLTADRAIGANGAVRWVNDPDGRPVVELHKNVGSEASGPTGPVQVQDERLLSLGVRALEPLDRFSLPVPPRGDDLIRAVRCSLGLSDLAPDTLTLPLLAATYRAPIGDANFSLSLDGVTGRGKSTLAALFQQHFGMGLDAEHLPTGWGSTANYLEAVAFRAKDMLFVIDDLVMRGSRGEMDRLNREADRFLRSQANRTGRGRCNANGTPRPTRHSRCLPVCTQEDSPGGHSLNARVFRLAVCDLDILSPNRLKTLNEYQSFANEGVLAQAMAGYISWLANDLEDTRSWHHERRQELIQAFQEDGRQPENVDTLDPRGR